MEHICSRNAHRSAYFAHTFVPILTLGKIVMYTKVRKSIGSLFVRNKGHQIHIMNHQEANINHYARTLQKTIDFVTAHFRNTTQPFSGITPADLKPAVQSIDFNTTSSSIDDLLLEVKSIYSQHAVAFHLPKYIAHLNCPVVTPSLAAEIIISALNSSMDTWDQSAGGTLMEMKLIDWTCEQLHLGASADGVFTSGGTQSNLMALLMARDYYINRTLLYNVKMQGLPEDAKRFRVFCSEKSHFSIKKACSILGLGEHAVVCVPVGNRFKMNTKELKNLMEKEIAQGNIPIAIVATAGTTDFGSIDPLIELGELAKEYGTWFHVDAAYGCGLMLSDNHRYKLSGIEYANSVTVDYHKSFFQPVSSSALLVSDKDTLRLMCYHADYLNPVEQEKDGYPNQVNKTIQTTRRFDALKLWFTLRLMGKDVLGEYIDQIIYTAKQAANMIDKDPDFELLNHPEISTLLFRYNPYSTEVSALNTLNQFIRKKLMDSGKALVASTKVNNEVYLKFTLLNPATTAKDISTILELIKNIGNEYARNN
ncbi:L-2,4-diaminobutyrate decarboxylase [Cytophaga hutchinsonii ATCC 33406]|nr:L-2,4-diaminobutyrate decarboxylase [Cytophaga hutchinsonii ATCC 33406]